MHKYFEIITEIIGWMQIVASPFLTAVMIGAIIYFPNQTTISLVVAVLVCIIGLCIGILIATKKFKSEKGTIWFLSRTMSTPELDEREENTK